MTADTVFSGAGEMRAACRDHAWDRSPLGPVEQWSVTLRATVQLVLAGGTPMLLFWGPDLIQIFNDAFRPSLGTGVAVRDALGTAAPAYWAEIWPTRGPQIAQVLGGGPPATQTDVCIPITRDGRLEDVWWTYTDTPVFGDDGEIAGVLITSQESTARVLAERRQAESEAATHAADRRAAHILEQVADEHLAMDADFRIVFMNAAAERALGVPRATFIGLTHWEAFPASVGTTAEQQYRRAMRERVAIHFAHRYRGEGYDRHLEIDAYPTDDGGLAVFWRDVSARVHAAQALEEVTDRYRILFESVDTGFAIIDVLVDGDGRAFDYRFVDVNAAFVEQTGLTDAVGRTATELVPGLESFWVETYAQVAATGDAVHFEQGSDAMGRWYDVSAVRVGSAAARRVALLFRDVTAQRLASAERDALLDAVARERERLRAVFQQAPAFIALLSGPQHVFEFANDAYYRLVGQRELVGKPVFDALPDVRGQGFEALLDGVLVSGEPYVGHAMPVRLVRTLGQPPEERLVDLTYTPMTDAHGERTGIIVHGADVTEQVRARRDVERLLAESEIARAAIEEASRQLEASQAATRRALDELEATYRTAPVGLAVIDAELRFQRVNARLAETNGLSVEGHLGRTVRDIVPDLADVVEPRLRRVLETGDPEFDVMLSGETPADPGNLRHWVEQWLPLRDRDGTVVGINVVAEEITERRRAESEREHLLQETVAAHAHAEQARRAAEEANRAKSEFLAIMSHELRTPLNAIDGYAELMELGIRGPVTAEQRQDLARIRKSEQHLLGLINGVLNYAQVDAGAAHYEFEAVPLDDVLVMCEALTAPQVRATGLTLRRAACPPGLTVHADREKLQQIVLNLLSNAIKFTEPGGRIDVRCLQVPQDAGPVVQVTVADTGIGIPASHLARIFEPFVQVNAELTRTRDGTGLGLAISRDLARGMGGELTVESMFGRGSTFTLTLRAL